MHHRQVASARVLITGCGGMLGSAVFPYFERECAAVLATDREAGEAWLEHLDVREPAAVERAVREFAPSLILHLAADTDLERCELDPGYAEDNNAAPSRWLGEISARRDIDIVYISTAGIFDGEKDGPYEERDAPNPLMFYGRSKLDGEVLLRERAARLYVVRAGWMVGGGPRRDHKFVSRILAQLADDVPSIYAVDDRWGTPTYTHDFAMNLFALLETARYGTYHMVCEGSATRYDVAREIVRICRRQDQVAVEPVGSEHFAKEFFAPRPRSEMLVNANLEAIGLNRMRPWGLALREYIEREFPHLIGARAQDAG